MFIKDCLDIPQIVAAAIEKKWTHVFFVVNPVVCMMTRMVIDAYGIDCENVIGVSIREADTKLVCDESIKPISRWYDRVLVKLFCDSPSGRRITKQLEQKKNNFIVYASWLVPEVERAVSSPYCKGHVYIEEGQISYYRSNPFKIKGDHKWKRRKNRLKGNVNYYFREDASAYIGLSKESFPMMARYKRFVLDNFDVAREQYNPRLIGVKNIGIMPAPIRIPKEHLESALRLFIGKMPEGGVIKLHPGFRIHTELRDHIVSAMKRISNGTVTLCDDDVIIELEMLFENKVLMGSRCSLSRYAEIFGSKYLFVEFDGYIPPLN